MADRAALLIIDVLNDFEFDGYERLLDAARGIVAPINRLREQARAAGIPTIYVNDNYGRWQDERSALIAWLSRDAARGHELARALAPADDDYFVIKPESSGFYATTLAALLPRLGVSRLILAGLAVDMCVLFTAADAHMREYPLWVPADAVAGADPEHSQWALANMRDNLAADIAKVDSRAID